MLRDSRVLLTGASGGLGPAIAEALLAVGAEVIAVARRRTGLDALRAGLSDHERLHTAECDISDPSGVEALFTAVTARAPLDAVVHAAGCFEYASIADIDDAAVRRLVEVNLLGSTWVLRAALRRMIPEKKGSIVLIAADRALAPAAGFGVYGATKAGVVHLVQTAAAEARPSGVRVNAILPGVIDTLANREAMPDADPSGWASPGDIARSVLWLAGVDAAGATGSLICVPGG